MPELEMNDFDEALPVEIYEVDRLRGVFDARAFEPEISRRRNDTEADRKKALLARLVSAAEPDTDIATPYVIKEVVYQKAPGLIFAPSQAAKTAILIDMARAITTGTEYYGKRTDPGFVIMLPVEDSDGIPVRVAAEASRLSEDEAALFRERYRRLKDPGLWQKGTQGDKAVDEVIEAARYYSEQTCLPCRMVQIDTMPKAIAGESVKDDDVLTRFIMRAQRIGEATGAAVLATAHPGHGNQTRTAGSVQNNGSFYTIIRVGIDQASSRRIQNTDRRTIHLDKVKGKSAGYPLGQYTLSTVSIGQDDDGDQIEGVVLDRLETIEHANKTKPKRSLTGAKARAAEVLVRLFDAGRYFTVKGKEIGIEGVAESELWHVVDEKEWRSACREKLLSDKGDQGSAEEISDRESAAFRRALGDLETKFHHIGRHGGLVWLVSHNKDRADRPARDRPPAKTYRVPGAKSEPT